MTVSYIIHENIVKSLMNSQQIMKYVEEGYLRARFCIEVLDVCTGGRCLLTTKLCSVDGEELVAFEPKWVAPGECVQLDDVDVIISLGI